MTNIINLTDSYKFSHFNQYPKGTEIIHSYLAPRGGDYDEIVFFGLQYYLKKYLLKPNINKTQTENSWILSGNHGVPFNMGGWNYIRKLGYLPIEIKALPEGGIYGNKEPLLTIENTDPNCAWLVGYLETLLLKIWYPTTIATKSYAVRKMLLKHWERTADNVDGVDFAYHNFGDRGSSSVESAAIGGVAHLTQFKGTDNFNALTLSNKYYDEKYQGFSIPACFDDQTEILTSKGFKKFSQLNQKDSVAQYSEDGDISFVIPSKIHEYEGHQRMIKFHSPSSDLMVTPNHRIVRFSHAKNKIEILEAEEAGYSHRNSLIVSGFSVKENDQLSMLDRLKIAFQADGSFPSRKEAYNGCKTGMKPIRFSLKKERKKERLEWILNDLDLKYSKSESPDGYCDYWIRSNEEFSKTFDWVNLDFISPLWAKEFLEEASNWDGNSPTSNTLRYNSTIKFNADIVQALGVLSGFRTSIYEYLDKRGDRKVIYSVNLLKNTTKLEGSYTKKSEVNDYKGKVYCVTVPTGMIVIRRNGLVCISGNSEHSTVTSWGRENEFEMIENYLETYKNNPIIACVLDSYDIYKAVDFVTSGRMKEKIESDDYPIFVIRPDSGDPIDVITDILNIMAKNNAQYIENSKGYILFKKYRIIWGDGITASTIDSILEMITNMGYSAENFAFGSGGDLMQNVNRDTCKFAMKCSAIKVNGEWRDVYKDPITDPSKKSIRGRVVDDRMKTVFKNGEIYAN